jgi:hypothetical protein
MRNNMATDYDSAHLDGDVVLDSINRNGTPLISFSIFDATTLNIDAIVASGGNGAGVTFALRFTAQSVSFGHTTAFYGEIRIHHFSEAECSSVC